MFKPVSRLPSLHNASAAVQLVQLLSGVRLFVTPWTAAHQDSMSITNSQSLLKLMPIWSAMSSNYLLLCPPLLLPSSIFLSIRVFSYKSVIHLRWPKYWSFSFSISPSNESDLISYVRPNRNLVLGLAPHYMYRLFSSCCQDRPGILR